MALTEGGMIWLQFAVSHVEWDLELSRNLIVVAVKDNLLTASGYTSPNYSPGVIKDNSY